MRVMNLDLLRERMEHYSCRGTPSSSSCGNGPGNTRLKRLAVDLTLGKNILTGLFKYGSEAGRENTHLQDVPPGLCSPPGKNWESGSSAGVDVGLI